MISAVEWISTPTWPDIIAQLESEPELAIRETITDELTAAASDPNLSEDQRLRIPALIALIKIARTDGVENARLWLVAQVEGQRRSRHRGIQLRSTLDLLMLTYTLENFDAMTWVDTLENHEWALSHPTLEQPHIRDTTDALRQVLKGSRPPLPPQFTLPGRMSRIYGVVGRLMRIRLIGNYIDNVEESVALLTRARELALPDRFPAASLDLADAYLSRTVQEPADALVQAIEFYREAQTDPARLSPYQTFHAATGLAKALGELAQRSWNPHKRAALLAEQLEALAAGDAAARDDADRAIVLMLRAQYDDYAGIGDAIPSTLDQLRQAVKWFDEFGYGYNQVLSRQLLAAVILRTGTRDPKQLAEVVVLAERGEALAVEYGLESEAGAARQQLVSADLLLGNWQSALESSVGLARSALKKLLVGGAPIARQAYGTIAAVEANNAAYAMLQLKADPYAALSIWDSSIGYTTRRSWTALEEAMPDDPAAPILDSMLAILRECDAAAQLIVTIAGASMVIVTSDGARLTAQILACDVDPNALAQAISAYSLFLAAQTDGMIVSGAKAKRELLSAALGKATPVVDAIAVALDQGGVPRESRIAMAGSFGLASLAIGAVPLSDGDLFGDQWTVRAVPGWTLVTQQGSARLARSDKLSNSVVVADTRVDLPLPYSRVEGDTAAAEIAARTHLVGREARREKVTEALKAGSGVAYFACHAYFSFDDPWDSGVKLADDDWAASDIVKMDLSRYELAVLSSCQSAVTDVRRAPMEYIGVRTALQQAGVRRVIGSAWAINDASTTLLMGRVLDNWQDAPEVELERALWDAQSWLRHATPNELASYIDGVRLRYRWWHPSERASRRALSDLINMLEREDAQSAPYADPFYWAAFTVW